MTRAHRIIRLMTMSVFAAVLFTDRPATAQSNSGICDAVGCSGGSQKCGEVYATFRDERCEEGVMCCPFPEESVSFVCYERNGVL